MPFWITKMKLRPFLFSALLSALSLCAPQSARGDVQYTIPQTVDAVLANNLACTGAAQTFITGTTAGFANLGQTQHYISVLGTSIGQLQAEIDGIDALGNVFPISDVLETGSAVTPAVVAGTGRYPKIQVKVKCTTGGSFTLTYAGTSATSNLVTGSYQTAQVSKLVFSSVAGNAAQSDSFQTPFGSAYGILTFAYLGATIGGSTLTLQCTDISGFSVGPQFTFSIANSVLAQPFFIPSEICPSVAISYASGGAAGNIKLSYTFMGPGVLSSNPLPVGSGQGPVTTNTEQVSGVNASVSKTITGIPAGRAYLYSVSARCSAGTASLTISDGGTTIWSTAATEVGVTTFRFQWSPGLAFGFNNAAVVTLSTCGAANTGTLDVQASQF